MIKDKNYYLAINYDIVLSELTPEDGGGYFAYYQDIDGVMGDGVTKKEAIADVKSAFNCYLDSALKNKDRIPEPDDLRKTKKINISMTADRITNLDVYAKKLNTSRSGLLSILTDKLINHDITINR
ncbi:type II toxin-antitoxin system HicB family antitoxin [Candidatus Woesearchaeota archaeon]|jgi:predicted RNase H-like HicB family nuclease|nr:type II toxin-antitoxin system HicB family antitoxin [Candidatus Woesearchaeota archaeon]